MHHRGRFFLLHFSQFCIIRDGSFCCIFCFQFVACRLSGLGCMAAICTRVALSLHPGLCSASPSGLLSGGNFASSGTVLSVAFSQLERRVRPIWRRTRRSLGLTDVTTRIPRWRCPLVPRQRWLAGTWRQNIAGRSMPAAASSCPPGCGYRPAARQRPPAPRRVP